MGIVEKYRKDRGYLTGVVVIFRSKIAGWMDELRNPEHWEPGCIAIDQDGKRYLSVGGNSYEGADKWELQDN